MVEMFTCTQLCFNAQQESFHEHSKNDYRPYLCVCVCCVLCVCDIVCATLCVCV